jgi:hypothetical protein
MMAPVLSSMNRGMMTNQDYYFAKFLAYERMQEFIGRRLRLLYGNPDSEYVQQLIKGSKRKWTGDKIELIEVVYGIYYTRRMNSGKAEVKDIVEWLEDTLQVDLGDAYRLFLDLKRRKGKSYTKFLKEMIEAIRKSIEEGNRFRVSAR